MKVKVVEITFDGPGPGIFTCYARPPMWQKPMVAIQINRQHYSCELDLLIESGEIVSLSKGVFAESYIPTNEQRKFAEIVKPLLDAVIQEVYAIEVASEPESNGDL